MNDKQRAEFERWIQNNTTFKNPVWLESHQEYDYTSTNMMWQAWQAAIASVVVKLPQTDVIQMTPNPDVMPYYCHQADEVKSALTDAGIRYE